MQSPSCLNSSPFQLSAILRNQLSYQNPLSCFESLGMSGAHNPNSFFPKKILKVDNDDAKFFLCPQLSNTHKIQ